MRPVVTPEEMAAIDAEAPEPVEELIERAAWATARAAIELLGSPYGKRVAILAGPGNNGEDARRAVPHLERRGARCTVIPFPFPFRPGTGGGRRFDLIVDGCVGTGLARPFDRSALDLVIGDTPVLAVDIPSGVDGLTGVVRGQPIPATATVTFAAAKPGLLLAPGRELAGSVTVADIGLDCGRATIHHVGPADVLAGWPRRDPDHHKWRSAVLVIGGSPGMTGAPGLAATAALRAGAGYATIAVPGTGPDGADGRDGTAGRTGDTAALQTDPVEAVAVPAPANWGDADIDRLDRHRSVVIGPGLVTAPAQLRAFLQRATMPLVIDAGALSALAALIDAAGPSTIPARVDAVLTPHEGEFATLVTALGADGPGREAVDSDRIGAVRAVAAALGAVVLLKGRTTVVADPAGSVLLSTAGDQRLATAGTGDVLSGVIGAGLAAGLDPLAAAGLGAELHGIGGSTGHRVGLVASDLPLRIAAVLSD
ncbi:MAG: NAD(P)H-hydrate dehydratase [Actinomycetota bacterium]